MKGSKSNTYFSYLCVAGVFAYRSHVVRRPVPVTQEEVAVKEEEEDVADVGGGGAEGSAPAPLFGGEAMAGDHASGSMQQQQQHAVNNANLGVSNSLIELQFIVQYERAMSRRLNSQC